MIYLKKSETAPASLALEKVKATGTYRCQDVYDALFEDFKEKCYICGTNKLNAGINIEHRIPHKGNRDLEFEWTNLFLSCFHCNNLKLANYDNILDCTNEEDDVDNRLKHSFISNGASSSLTVTPLDSDEKTIYTAHLIQAVFEGTTTAKKFEANVLRKDVVKELNEMLIIIKKYESSVSEIHEGLLLEDIKQILSRKSPYTAIKRWYVKDTLNKPELASLFD